MNQEPQDAVVVLSSKDTVEGKNGPYLRVKMDEGGKNRSFNVFEKQGAYNVLNSSYQGDTFSIVYQNSSRTWTSKETGESGTYLELLEIRRINGSTPAPAPTPDASVPDAPAVRPPIPPSIHRQVANKEAFNATLKRMELNFQQSGEVMDMLSVLDSVWHLTEEDTTILEGTYQCSCCKEPEVTA